MALAAQPNFVILLADDLGWADLGSYGNRWTDTPHLDRLAKQGIRFTNAYAAAPVCAPTRASILTGQYPARLGLTSITRPHRRPWAKLAPPPNAFAVEPGTPTIASELARAGYRSTLIGKWHLGYGNSPFDLDKVAMPPGFGLATPAIWFGFQKPPAADLDASDAAARFARENPGKSTGPIALRGVRFLEQIGDAPFFLELSFPAPHIPMETRTDLVEKYRKMLDGEDASLDPRYAGMVEALDEACGVILDALDRLGLADNTWVFFFSDNGGLHRVYHGDGPRITDNAPLRGEKGTLYEGGIRVPLIVRPPGGALARTEDAAVISNDLFPTLLELAGVPTGLHDGVSWKPLLEGSGQLPERDLFWHYPAYHHSEPAATVRSGSWKLIERYESGRRELYNLADSISETFDRSADHPEIVADLVDKLHRWQTSVGARFPTANPHHDPEKEALWGVRPAKPWQNAPRHPLEITRVE